MESKLIEVYSKEDFRKWLAKNHDKEKKIGLILHKKHTGKTSPSHKELMHEAICFGWIDTTIKRLDEDRFIRFFSRRTKNSTWSYNTLSYAKKLIKQKRMTPHGLTIYKEGLKKKPHDHGIPDSPNVPKELKEALDKNPKAKENFKNLAPSYRKTYLRWLFRAKQEKTRKKRIDTIVKNMAEGKGNPGLAA